MILKYKEEVEAELEEIKWKKISQKIMEEAKIDLKPAVIRKRFLELRESGWVVGAALGKEGEGDDDDDDKKKMPVEEDVKEVVEMKAAL